VARSLAVKPRPRRVSLIWLGGGCAVALVTLVWFFKSDPARLTALMPVGLFSPHSSSIVPTTVEDSRTAPRVLHPSQSGKPESPSATRSLGVYAIRVGATSQDSTAVLGHDAASAHTYGVGAILANDAEITAIYPDRVELSRADAHYTLYTAGAEPGAVALAQAAEAAKSLGTDSWRPVDPAP
jgi:Type II secretion system protein C